MPAMAKWPNSVFSKGFSVLQVAQKHGWPEPMVWSQALNKKDDQTQFLEKFFPRITKVTIDILDTLKSGEGKESDNNPLL